MSKDGHQPGFDLTQVDHKIRHRPIGVQPGEEGIHIRLNLGLVPVWGQRIRCQASQLVQVRGGHADAASLVLDESGRCVSQEINQRLIHSVAGQHLSVDVGSQEDPMQVERVQGDGYQNHQQARDQEGQELPHLLSSRTTILAPRF